MKRCIPMAAMIAAATLGLMSINPASAESSSTISGFVYVDLNNNGVMNPGEPGIAGVTLTLSGDASNTTTTNAAGAYTLVASPACCTYSVTETQPAGYADGIDSIGTGSCGGGTLGNDVITNICLDGNTAINYNFGELPLTTPTSVPSATATEQRKLKTHTPTATPTSAPSTATPTPQPATSTPALPSATKPAGGAAGVVRGPDTGTGGSGTSGTSSVREFALLAFALFAAGSAVAGQGIRRRVQQRG